MKRPARRSILRMIALLLAWGAAGATLNVAVAWGILATHPNWIVQYGMLVADTTDADEAWVQRHGHRLRDDSQTVEWTYRATGSRTNMLAYPTWARAFQEHDIVVQLPFEPYVEQIRVGWPTRALYGAFWASFKDNDTGIAEPVFEYSKAVGAPWRGNKAGIHYFLPLYPLWPGFAINTLFYAGVLWVLWETPFALRRMIRRRRGRCPACNYPIGQSPVCTECGAPHAAVVQSPVAAAK